MKQSNLIEHIQFPDTALPLFDESTVVPPKQSCLLLYHDKSSLNNYILPRLTIHKATTLVISCMDNDIIRKNFDHVVQSRSFPETTKILEDLYNCDRKSQYVLGLLDTEINHVIVHNISAFYFDLEVLDKYNYKKLGFRHYNPSIPHDRYYDSLAYLLKKVCEKYRYSGIVTSYDVEFNCGMLGTYTYKPLDELQKFTKLPVSFIKQFNRAVYFSQDQEIKTIK
ncbi:hypothetical protein Cantr_05556 [Candida viswanathii]|uniref:Uncharacterized protein n=1 Tax=Candida viswanathii TaxID=5486 RepID=A0A367XRQ3_9ASCO|nr:hypothetical protein Cantr_05556 [Candida viswanathii]